MAEWTKERLADLIYEEMSNNGGERLKAADKVVKRIGNSGQAKPFLDALGVWLLVYFEREWCRNEAHPRPNFPAPANYGRNLKAEAATLVNAMVPIGNTGLRKPIGQLTCEDCMSVADYHRHLEETNRMRRIGWESVAEEIPDGQTLADAWSKLSDDSREFLRRIARVQKEEAA